MSYLNISSLYIPPLDQRSDFERYTQDFAHDFLVENSIEMENRIKDTNYIFYSLCFHYHGTLEELNEFLVTQGYGSVTLVEKGALDGYLKAHGYLIKAGAMGFARYGMHYVFAYNNVDSSKIIVGDVPGVDDPDPTGKYHERIWAILDRPGHG